MLDKKSILVLKALNKLQDSSAYKVVTTDEIISALTSKTGFDLEGVKQIVSYLEKQEFLNIKFSEENTYCYSLLPKARIYLEQEATKPKSKKNKPILTFILTILASFIGTMLALLIFFYLI